MSNQEQIITEQTGIAGDSAEEQRLSAERAEATRKAGNQKQDTPKPMNVEQLRKRKAEIIAKIQSNQFSSPQEKAQLLEEKSDVISKLQNLRDSGEYTPPAPQPRDTKGLATIEQLQAELNLLKGRVEALEKRVGTK